MWTYLFHKGACYVARVALEFMILLPQLPRCWTYRCYHHKWGFLCQTSYPMVLEKSVVEAWRGSRLGPTACFSSHSDVCGFPSYLECTTGMGQVLKGIVTLYLSSNTLSQFSSLHTGTTAFWKIILKSI